jgi:NO-binding membrane sensor protein with MHYT domain
MHYTGMAAASFVPPEGFCAFKATRRIATGAGNGSLPANNSALIN